MAESFDVLLNILLNRNAARATKEGIKEIDASLKDMGGAFPGDELGADFAKFNAGLDKSTEKQNKFADATKKTIAVLRDQSEILTKQAAIASLLSSGLGSFGTKAAVAGAAIGGGILAEATAYAKKMGDATKETREFNAELAKIAAARGRIDAVLTAQVLPLLRVASQVAEKTAGIIEKNPQLVDFALKGAALLVGIGTLAKLASAGLKIYADATFFTAQNIGLQAAQMQLAASQNQLAAAGAGTGVGGGAAVATGGGKVLQALSVATMSVALLSLAVGATNAVLDAVGQPRLEEMFKAELGFLEGLPRVLAGEIKLNDLAAEMVNGAQASAQARKEIQGLTGSVEKLGNAAQMASAAAAYSDYVQANAASNMQFAQQKAQIESNYTQQVQGIYQQHAAAMSSIGSQLSSSLKSIEANYTAQRLAAEQNYQQQRSQIVAQGAAQIEQIQRDAQERLRQLEQEHTERVGELTNARDALGLAQENRDYEQARNEEMRRAQEEIARAKEQTAQQLAELDARYAAEQQQAQQQYELQKQQAIEQAAQQTAQESANFALQLAQAQAAKDQQMKELEDKHKQELAQNRNAFINQLRELGIYLGDDYNLQVEYHNRMLEETRRFLEAQNAMYAEQQPSAPNAPVHDFTGYAYPGLYRMAQDGQKQFVLSGSATRSLESMVGGKLTQSSVMEQVRNGGSSVQIVDNKQYYRGISPRERKEIRQDLVETLDRAFSGV